MSLKWEIKLTGSLCTSLTIEKPWRIVQPFLQSWVKEPPLTSPCMKLKHQRSGSDLFTISSTVEISGFFNLSFAGCRTHITPAEPGSSTALKRKQFTFHKLRAQEVKKKPHRVCKNSKIQRNWCENCWKYASCSLLFMPTGQWCSKGNFASLQQQNWWIHVKPVVHYLSPHEHTLGRKAVFHWLCQRMCPVWALCWLKGSLHCWERHGPRLPEEVQKLQQPKKGVPMSECKFKQHKDSSRAAQSVFVPCHPLDPVFPFSSLLVQVQQLKKVFNIWAEPDIPLSRTVPQKPTQGPCVCY